MKELVAEPMGGLGSEGLGREGWFVGLDLGFLDFLFVFSLGKTVSFSMCQVITSFPLQLFRFEPIWQKKKTRQ